MYDEFKTTFWTDFSIADRFGKAAVKDTFNRAFKEWRNDVTYVTELAIVTNWKCWQHYEKGHEDLSRLYAELYHKVDGWCRTHLKGEDARYYFEMTD